MKEHAVLLVLAGCAGPVDLQRAVQAPEAQAFNRELAAQRGDARLAHEALTARRLGITMNEARRRDLAISTTKNPFDARRDADAVCRGAVVYAALCARCHGLQADGRGPDALASHPCRNFRGPAMRMAVTLHGGAPRRWFQRIADGYGPPVRYPDGESRAMPAFGDRLAREQIWLVITYLQSLDACFKPHPGESSSS